MENTRSPPHSLSPTPAIARVDRSDSALNLDAFADFQFGDPHPLDPCASFHPTHLHSSSLDSSFFNGEKPPWGWDYVLAFKIPPYMKTKNKHRSPPLSPATDQSVTDDGDANVERAVDRGEEPAANDAQAVGGGTTPFTQRDRQLVEQRVEILARLKSAGFVFSQIFVPSAKSIFVRISLPEDCMKEKAIKLGMELKLKSEYGGGYLAFSRERETVFVNYDRRNERRCYFAPADRSIIILSVLQSKEDWGCALNIEELVHDGTLLQAFAVHSNRERNMLIAETVWKRIWDPTYQPSFEAMKDYLGARVTFYFVFTSFYARRLFPVALLSIPIYILYRVLQNVLVIAILRWVFAIALVLWTTAFLESWKRRNANVSLEWGLDDYQEDVVDDIRPQFVGERRAGFYTCGGFVPLEDLLQSNAESVEGGIENNQLEAAMTAPEPPMNPYEDPRVARNTRLQSLMVTLIFVFFVGSVTFLLLWWRNDLIDYFVERTGNAGFANAVPGVLNGVLITVFDYLWKVISEGLTHRENHRTNQEFENSLVYKRFAFQFISNYVSLFYIAFIKPNLENNTCVEGYHGRGPDCMVELEIQLMSLVITKATIQQLMEVGFPYVSGKVRQWRANSRLEEETEKGMGGNGDNQYVTEANLTPYTETIDDYGELVIQFGYLVLFGLAFPPAAVIALLNNLIEGRLDAYKILGLSQRVNADDAADIGAWYTILEFLNVMSVLCNAGLVVFTADAGRLVLGLSEFEFWQDLVYRVVAFFVMEHVLLGVKGLAAFFIEDVPRKTKRRKARQKYDIARFFDIDWLDAYRGNSLLVVDEQQVELCGKFADVFDKVSTGTSGGSGGSGGSGESGESDRSFGSDGSDHGNQSQQ